MQTQSSFVLSVQQEKHSIQGLFFYKLEVYIGKEVPKRRPRIQEKLTSLQEKKKKKEQLKSMYKPSIHTTHLELIQSIKCTQVLGPSAKRKANISLSKERTPSPKKEIPHRGKLTEETPKRESSRNSLVFGQ